MSVSEWIEWAKSLENGHVQNVLVKQDRSQVHWKDRGNEELNMHRYERAVEMYTLGLQQHWVSQYDFGKMQYFAILYTNRGVALRALKEMEKALVDATQAVFVCPGYAKGWYQRGITVREGKVEDGIDHFEIAKMLIENRPLGIQLAAEAIVTLKMNFNISVEDEMPQESKKYNVVEIEGFGRGLVASRKVNKGDCILRERPLVSVLLKHEKWYCSYCMKNALAPLPCHQCSSEMYCSLKCKGIACRKYHNLECKMGILEEPELCLALRHTILSYDITVVEFWKHLPGACLDKNVRIRFWQLHDVLLFTQPEWINDVSRGRKLVVSVEEMNEYVNGRSAIEYQGSLTSHRKFQYAIIQNKDVIGMLECVIRRNTIVFAKFDVTFQLLLLKEHSSTQTVQTILDRICAKTQADHSVRMISFSNEMNCNVQRSALLELGFNEQLCIEVTHTFKPQTTLNPTQLAEALQAHYKNVPHEVGLKMVSRVHQVCAMLKPFFPFSCFDKLLKYYFITKTNVHSISGMSSCPSTNAVQESSKFKIGLGLYPTAAIVNHSCVPNCILKFNGSSIALMVVCDIILNDQLFISYGPCASKQPTHLRRQMLSAEYYFVCSCKGCLEGGEDLLTFEGKGVETTMRKMHITCEVSVLQKCLVDLQKALPQHHHQIAVCHDLLAKQFASNMNFTAAIVHLEIAIQILLQRHSDTAIEMGYEYLKLAQICYNGDAISKSKHYVQKADTALSPYISEDTVASQDLCLLKRQLAVQT